MSELHSAASRRDDAVRRLRRRHVVVGQRVTHHAAARDQAHDVVGVAAAERDRARRSVVPIGASMFCGVRTPPPVMVTMRDVSGSRAARKRYGERRADVLAHVAELARVAAARHLFAGQQLDELALAARRVDRRHLGELQPRIVDGFGRILDGLHRLRLVALDGDDAARRREHVG